MRSPKELPIVEVLWEDAFSNPRWMRQDEVEATMGDRVLVRTVGRLVSRDLRGGVVTVGSVTSEGWFGELHRIPRGMVVKITPLSRRR